ncbi:hypothetical protein ACFPK9_02875 [Rubritalea spongiae]|uniref:GAPS4 PD-(D/E)XK nuclease domain-containing protein n=1 Tax=Rubritalea spongiae TaxID=430797 RepID=A0ABW5E4N0_9BACT
MGEKSKTSGEDGEKLASDFFNLIGWNANKKGLSIPCSDSNHLNKDGNSRKTHGVDILFPAQSWENPQDFVHHLISVKHTIKPYVKNLSSKFNEFSSDIQEALSCYKRSSVSSNYSKGKSRIENIKYVGILFWISEYLSTKESVLEGISSSRSFSDSKFDGFYVLDNRRVHFIRDSIKFAKTDYSKTEFVNINDSSSLDPADFNTSSTVMPAALLASNVIPFKSTCLGRVDKLINR